MKVSVITVALNPGSALLRTLQSVSQQDYTPFEWLIIDGGSTDGSLNEYAKYADRISRLVSEHDNGIADAMNKGWRASRGEAVVFLNAGDAFADATVLSRLVLNWDRTRFEWATGGAIFHSAKGKELYTRILDSTLSPAGLVQRRCQIAHASSIVKRGVFERHGGFDTSFRSSIDYELWLRLISRCVYPQLLPFPVARFYAGGASAQVIRRCREDARARRQHGMGNGFLFESWLTTVAHVKHLLQPLRQTRIALSLKEKLRL